MIDINRSLHLGHNPAENITIKIVGIGGAGSNALDRIVLDGVENADLVAMNTDVQALTGSVAAEKVQLGREVTRGLGAGGDPELGVAAAEESLEAIRTSLEHASMVFVCVGLGGGTGSGAAPLIAGLAKEQGALVVVFATMPFGFEGKRRRRQADEALEALAREADAVICFENDKMGDAISPKAGIHQAFASADLTISQSVRAIASLFKRPGLIHIGFDDLRVALQNHGAQCVFGFGEAEGDNRANEALTRALKSSLMDRGRMLGDAQSVLVNICGGPEMTLNEVQILMEELGKHISDDAQIRFGSSVDRAMGNRMSVTIISSVAVEVEQVAKPQPAVIPPVALPPRISRVQPKPVAKRQPVVVEPEPVETDEDVEEMEQPAVASPAESFVEAVAEPMEEAHFAEPSAPDSPASEDEAGDDSLFGLDEPKPAAKAPAQVEKPAARPRPPVTRPPRIITQPSPVAAFSAAPKSSQEKQETLQFEPVTRGRFEKSEPTIVDGQDLDVPTFLRRNVRVK